MNKILLMYDGKEIILTTEQDIEDVVGFFNLNIDSDTGFVLIKSIEGKIGLKPRLVTLIKDVTNEENFNISKNLKCNINVDAEKIAIRLKDILREEVSGIEALGN
ncbi:hypothetical protein [Clostridium tertium]|uniref:hypothetical protein n=1 Tax=Clostridium tertium TaxID=1559 RepID=UPI0011596C05|nr:hypothetical protein [Clostridium tertium]MDY4605410.1 hypothetical protein [Clostridium tertium]